jgi:hypothetical protein
MPEIPRQRSPRAPSIDLGEAVEKVRAIYAKQRLHAGPTDVVAQHLGYKNANNGAAVQVIASLRYYGLIERPRDGMLAVTKEVEEFQYVPSDQARQGILRRWLTAPSVFSQLLVKYEAGLPADQNLRFDLIQLGFSPNAAEALIPVLRRSADYAGYFDHQPEVEGERVLIDEPSAPEAAVLAALREPTPGTASRGEAGLACYSVAVLRRRQGSAEGADRPSPDGRRGSASGLDLPVWNEHLSSALTANQAASPAWPRSCRPDVTPGWLPPNPTSTTLQADDGATLERSSSSTYRGSTWRRGRRPAPDRGRTSRPS